jgi:hypothetical protein
MVDQNPHVASFVARVRDTYKPAAPETFWECEGLFAELVAEPFLPQVLNAELAQVSDHPRQVTNWIGSELVLHRGAGFSLSVSILDVPRRYIHSLPYHAMYAAVGGTGLRCNLYGLPSSYRNEIFDPSLKLIAAGSRTAGPRELLCLPGGRHAYDFAIEQPTPVLKFLTAAVYPLEWLFTRSGLQAWQANDADLSFTQLRVAADVVGAFAHQTSVEPLRKLTQHKHHAVRWTAIQNLARLSRSEAIASLREAVNDEHPHVQRAAQKTLAKLTVK